MIHITFFLFYFLSFFFFTETVDQLGHVGPLPRRGLLGQHDKPEPAACPGSTGQVRQEALFKKLPAVLHSRGDAMPPCGKGCDEEPA